MKNKLRLFVSLFLLIALILVGLVALMIFTRIEPVLDEELLSPTAPVFLSDEQLTALWLTRTQVATYDPEGTRFWLRRTQMAIQAAATATHTVVAEPPTPTYDLTRDYITCAWSWATQQNPALTAEIRDRLTALVDIIDLRAESFGENCYGSDGRLRNFAAMETDFRIFLQVDALPGNESLVQEALSQLTIDVLTTLADYPPDSTPGPMAGRINVEFTARNAQGAGYWFQTNYQQAMAALEQRLTGPALFEALGGLRTRDQIAPT